MTPAQASPLIEALKLIVKTPSYLSCAQTTDCLCHKCIALRALMAFMGGEV